MPNYGLRQRVHLRLLKFEAVIAQPSSHKVKCQIICRQPLLIVQVFNFTAGRRGATLLQKCILIDTPLPHALLEKIALHNGWSFFPLPPTILEQNYHFKPIALPEETHRADGTQDALSSLRCPS